MTFFQPEQKSLINYVIGALVGVSLLASVLVISSYNRSVNLEHEILAAELDIRKLQTEKSQLQDKIFALLDEVNLQKFSNNRNLIEEKNPQYLKISGQLDGNLAASQTR
ncbi:MAG: hypothetical protein AAB536_03005 [Patescibacteria group bacterium]